ncbi:hypothetical protein J6590_105934, partial [Homalodisca vitripennis]
MSISMCATSIVSAIEYFDFPLYRLSPRASVAGYFNIPLYRLSPRESVVGYFDIPLYRLSPRASVVGYFDIPLYRLSPRASVVGRYKYCITRYVSLNALSTLQTTNPLERPNRNYNMCRLS